MQPTSAARGRRPAFVWAGILIGICLLGTWASRSRTPINTELWALHLASGPFSEHIEAVRQDLVHPPLMYIVHRAWIAAFGMTSEAVKTLPLLFALPAIVLFTLLAYRVTVHWRAASSLFACAFTAANAPAAMTRMYGMGLLLTVIAILLWDRWRSHASIARLLAWFAVMVLLVYTHFFGVLLLPAFVLVNWLHGARPRVFALAAGLAGLSFLPWAVYIWPVYRARGLETNLWWVEMIFHNPIRAAAALPMEWMGPPPISDLRVAAAVALAITLAMAIAGGRSAWRIEWFRICVLWALVPAGLLFLVSSVSTNALHGRFLLGVLPAFWLCIALLAEGGTRVATILLYGAVLPWTAASTVLSIWQVQNPSDARIAATRLARELAPGDAIAATEDANRLYWEWAVVLGRPEPVRLVRVVEPQSNLEARRVAQAERLSAVRLIRIEDINVPAGRSLWLFAGERPSESAQRLDRLGYSDAGSAGVLRRFVRRQSAGLDITSPVASPSD